MVTLRILLLEINGPIMKKLKMKTPTETPIKNH
jgi:hypothetical protein